MLITILIFLVLVSALFSAAETAMMAVNRYRLKHLARKGSVPAARALKLLERPDRLLGVILTGDTFSDILASSIATMLAMHWYGDIGALFASIVLTVVVLIFGETAPKTWAALHSQRVALQVSGPLTILLKILYPIVWLVNGMSNAFLKLFGVSVKKMDAELLSVDELRSIVHESSGRMSSHYQEILLRVLDLQQITVEEVMVQKQDIYGIDLDEEWSIIVLRLMRSPHAWLPLYYEHIDKIEGTVRLREVLVMLRNPEFDKAALIAMAQEPYFIPEAALLHQQLLNFQREKKQAGLVVDEYGAIRGLLTLRDVLEEIAGDFAMTSPEAESAILQQSDGSILVEGSISIRELNREMHWHLPVDGPRTLSGLIIEHLESIPKANVSVRVSGYPMEVVSVSRNTIRQVRIWPKLFSPPRTE